MKDKLIKCREMFRGTLTQTSVYPREVAKVALECNAASVIFAHNHPTGTPEPSNANRYLTRMLRQAMELFEIRVLDHIIVADSKTFSFSEQGIL